MRFLTFACIALIAFIALAFAYYVWLTNNIIKTQEREIGALKREREALKKHIARLSRRKVVKVENITINTDPDNVPSYPSKEGFK
jgi:uncharacterized membrane protein